MSARSEVPKIIRTYLGNPFAVDAEEWREGEELLGSFDFSIALARLVRGGDLDTAKNLILAWGHAQACRSDKLTGLFDASVLPDSVAKKLPRPRSAYLRIAAAAGRCYRALSAIHGQSEIMQLTRRATWAACFGDSLRNALELERVIHDHDVLILGDTGTGKESFARAIMAATPGPADGSPAPMAAINAAAIPDSLVESELFGHVRGAFTGATETRGGRLRSADGGSFFLDEVGDLPRTTQVKLLRVIETNEVFPVGSDTSHHAEVRYVAATHKDLEKMVEEQDFRRDLYERLAGNVVRIPPLRERPEDVIDIGRNFVRQYVATGDIPNAVESFLHSREARNYDWPGNVRELQNALRNLLLGLDPGLKTVYSRTVANGDTSDVPAAIAESTAPLSEVEHWYLRRVLAACEGNFSQAARILGLDRSTVRRRIDRNESS